jgi:hypothetical protein
MKKYVNMPSSYTKRRLEKKMKINNNFIRHNGIQPAAGAKAVKSDVKIVSSPTLFYSLFFFGVTVQTNLSLSYHFKSMGSYRNMLSRTRAWRCVECYIIITFVVNVIIIISCIFLIKKSVAQ